MIYLKLSGVNGSCLVASLGRWRGDNENMANEVDRRECFLSRAIGLRRGKGVSVLSSCRVPRAPPPLRNGLMYCRSVRVRYFVGE